MKQEVIEIRRVADGVFRMHVQGCKVMENNEWKEAPRLEVSVLVSPFDLDDMLDQWEDKKTHIVNKAIQKYESYLRITQEDAHSFFDEYGVTLVKPDMKDLISDMIEVETPENIAKSILTTFKQDDIHRLVDALIGGKQ